MTHLFENFIRSQIHTGEFGQVLSRPFKTCLKTMSHRATVGTSIRSELQTGRKTQPTLDKLRYRNSGKSRRGGNTLVRQGWLLVWVYVKRHIRNVLRHVRVNFVTILIHQRRQTSLFTCFVHLSFLTHIISDR